MHHCLCFSSWQLPPRYSGTSVSSVEEPCACIKRHFLHPCVWFAVCCNTRDACCTRVFAVYYQCLLGRSCGNWDKCLSSSQWCDGVKDCSHGEDESQCCESFTSAPSLARTHSISERHGGERVLSCLLHSSPPWDQPHASGILIRAGGLDAGVC